GSIDIDASRQRQREREEKDIESFLVPLTSPRNPQRKLLLRRRLGETYKYAYSSNQSRLFVCNPYLEQSRLVQTKNKFHRKSDMYLLGYDNNNHHKILSFSIVDSNIKDIEVYCFSSDTWRVLDVGPMYCNLYSKIFVSLKGNTYFCSPDHASEEKNGLFCFDFTTERFGPLLPLPPPFHSGYYKVTDIISSNEKLVLLHNAYVCEKVEIWITTKIEPNLVLWNKFWTLDWYFIKGLFPDDYWLYFDCRSWFIDEEKKVVVFFDITPKTCFFQMAYIIGEDGYFRSVNLGAAPYPEWVYHNIEYYIYVPSLVQVQV
ncbi:hypothetical protein HID58_090354, partial [Brassica napus]